ncbi:MAG: hypothetical protein QOF20_278 [Acidimicrobiaceae bacterium]|jgi:hypothetical protein|nr:hypothetical protein [Acidimicrobiaceae bacterium]MDQ1367925.1 hypothetical protein [Acidimicrobiaceae bacterium]MDQ1398922.1 hypothetical protein [Acidimicrobiaceae bacterium]MDQ1414043.1 hypothetical protein [Acidimicrobiaceae bacterium]MDQ1416662.1 hypothetical protein [Acidimicrobiaceae bacterium]
MSSLDFEVLGARAQPYAAVPTIMFKIRITEASGYYVHAVALRAQIMIEPQRRSYNSEDHDRLYELFDDPKRWGTTLKPFLWTHTGIVVPRFDGTIEVDLPMTCTYDFEVAGNKYLHSLRDGEVPLQFLFAGTFFTNGDNDSGFAAEPVGWNKDRSFKMPVQVWRECMDMYFPNSGWIRARKETIDLLTKYKVSKALPTWEDTIEALLKQAGEDV